MAEENFVQMKEEAERMNLNVVERLKQDLEMSMRAKEFQFSEAKNSLECDLAAANAHIRALSGTSGSVLQIGDYHCYFPPNAVEKDDLKWSLFYLNDDMNKLTYSNAVLENANQELSKKLHLAVNEKEQIQCDLTKQLRKATFTATVSNNLGSTRINTPAKT